VRQPTAPQPEEFASELPQPASTSRTPPAEKVLP
jgi:hypothetical protein